MTRMKKILIVDDADNQRRLVRVVLEKGGFHVVEAHDGADALALATADIDLIITDYYMPGMDGVQLVDKLSQTLDMKNVPVIMLTSTNVPDIKRAARDVGIIAWLTKPLNPERLLGTINTLFKDS